MDVDMHLEYQATRVCKASLAAPCCVGERRAALAVHARQLSFLRIVNLVTSAVKLDIHTNACVRQGRILCACQGLVKVEYLGAVQPIRPQSSEPSSLKQVLNLEMRVFVAMNASGLHWWTQG